MSDYSSPRKPDFDAFRLIVNEIEVIRYMRRFPFLSRACVLEALIAAQRSRALAEQLLEREAAREREPSAP